LIKATPVLLYYDGQLLEATLRRERVPRREVEAAARQDGLVSLNQVFAVVLETDGSITVIRKTQQDTLRLLSHVSQH
jgi:uncharacterized membrane protein YcaP (DUF421 family)